MKRAPARVLTHPTRPVASGPTPRCRNWLDRITRWIVRKWTQLFD